MQAQTSVAGRIAFGWAAPRSPRVAKAEKINHPETRARTAPTLSVQRPRRLGVLFTHLGFPGRPPGRCGRGVWGGWIQGGRLGSLQSQLDSLLRRNAKTPAPPWAENTAFASPGVLGSGIGSGAGGPVRAERDLNKSSVRRQRPGRETRLRGKGRLERVAQKPPCSPARLDQTE